jgi:primosomal protein N''
MQEMHESQLQERHRRGAWKLHTLRTCPACAFASTSQFAKEEEYHNRVLFYERKRIENFCEEEVRDTICHITNKQEGANFLFF